MTRKSVFMSEVTLTDVDEYLQGGDLVSGISRMWTRLTGDSTFVAEDAGATMDLSIRFL